MSARTTANGVLPPANSVAAPSDRAVATAGAMWVMDWNSTSVSPIAFRSRPRESVEDATDSSSPSHDPTAARRDDVGILPTQRKGNPGPIRSVGRDDILRPAHVASAGDPADRALLSRAAPGAGP